MIISDILAFFNIISDDKREIEEIYDNSLNIQKNSLFIALGKANQYVDEARKKGAIMTISDEHRPDVIYIANLKNLLTPFCTYFYHHPEQKIKLIGVTGTNGKSTSAYLIHGFLPSSLLITTTTGIAKSIVTRNTTPSGVELVKIINLAVKRHYTYLIMEVSSIGIAESRVRGLDFHKFLFTNLTQDHLDYHQSIENYRKTKIEYLCHLNCPVYLNEHELHRFPRLQDIKQHISFSLNEMEVVYADERGVIFQYADVLMVTKLIGEMNLNNLVGVLALVRNYMSLKQLRRRLLKIKPLRGRMNIVAGHPLVVIDYAHTASALRASLMDMLAFKRAHLIVVFGAGGNRDKSKRHEYGSIVAKYADIGIVTSDNPREEDAKDIIDDIVGDSTFYFLKKANRHDAIALAFTYANKNDAILISGKGAEEFQIVGREYQPFSDFAEVKKCLNKK